MSIDERSNAGWTELMRASIFSDILSVEHLINQGANINDQSNRGRSPLMMAVHGNSTTHNMIINLLLEHNADLELKDDQGGTALIMAAYTGNIETVRCLLNAKADIEASDNDIWTPLIQSVLSDSPEVAKLLIQHGANRSAKSADGKTALDHAKENNKHNLSCVSV